MNRTNQILAAVLVFQIVLAAVVFWPGAAASDAGGGAILGELEADQIVRLTIHDGEGKQITLAHKDDVWVLPHADDYPCLGNKVPDLLDKIVALESDRLITKTTGSHKRLQVADDDFERLIEFELADGTTHKLYLGSSPSYKAIHVRADGQDEVYLASGLSTLEAKTHASNWVDTQYFSVIQDQIVALTLENQNGRFEFEKDAAGTWTMKDLAADETLSQYSVSGLVGRAASMRMLRPLGKTEQADYGLQDPNAVVTIQTRDDEGNEATCTLRVGAQSAEDDSFVIISSESPYYVRASAYMAKDFVEKGREDFLEQPTPEPETTPTPTS